MSHSIATFRKSWSEYGMIRSESLHSVICKQHINSLLCLCSFFSAATLPGNLDVKPLAFTHFRYLPYICISKLYIRSSQLTVNYGNYIRSCSHVWDFFEVLEEVVGLIFIVEVREILPLDMEVLCLIVYQRPTAPHQYTKESSRYH
jgi:hypothetical protein